MKRSFEGVYKKLYASFGPQHWWPARSPFEVMVGAILTQNTSWSNVERAIGNIKKRRLLSAVKLRRLPHKSLARLIRSAGYYNIKAKRLKHFLDFFVAEYKASTAAMKREDTGRLREKLLEVNGIGEETADSILLYALDKPVFVVDAYTKRIFSRHGLIPGGSGYSEVQKAFKENLKSDSALFNEYHALIVRLAKDYCLKNNPRCSLCPLNEKN